jgi:hypothetical protein
VKFFANRVLAVLLVGILLTIGTLAYLAGNRTVSTYPTGSPEATVQNFLKAVSEKDSSLAQKYLEPETDCNINDLNRAVISPDLAVNLLKASQDEETARIDIQIKYNSNALFNDGYSEIQIIRLINIKNQWKITGIPWPLYGCGEPK